MSLFWCSKFSRNLTVWRDEECVGRVGCSASYAADVFLKQLSKRKNKKADHPQK